MANQEPVIPQDPTIENRLIALKKSLTALLEDKTVKEKVVDDAHNKLQALSKKIDNHLERQDTLEALQQAFNDLLKTTKDEYVQGEIRKNFKEVTEILTTLNNVQSLASKAQNLTSSANTKTVQNSLQPPQTKPEQVQIASKHVKEFIEAYDKKYKTCNNNTEYQKGFPKPEPQPNGCILFSFTDRKCVNEFLTEMAKTHAFDIVDNKGNTVAVSDGKGALKSPDGKLIQADDLEFNEKTGELLGLKSKKPTEGIEIEMKNLNRPT